MSTKNNLNLKLSFILSLILHIALLVILGTSAFTYIRPNNGDNGDMVNAIMVDPTVVSEQYLRQQTQQKAIQELEYQREHQSEQRNRELRQKQAEEQQRLKELERQRLESLKVQQKELEAAKQAQEAKLQAEQEAAKTKALLEEQKKEALLAKQKAVEEAERAKLEAKQLKQKAEEAAKLEAEKQKQREEAAKIEAEKQKQRQEAERLKAEQEKQKQLAEKKKQEEELKNQQSFEDILGDLTSSEPKIRQVQQGVSSEEIDKFKTQVHNAIASKFINSKTYRGKSCVIKIMIARDGLILDVSTGKGDPILCREAMAVAKKTIMPKPSSDAIYQQVKNLAIDFRPK